MGREPVVVYVSNNDRDALCKLREAAEEVEGASYNFFDDANEAVGAANEAATLRNGVYVLDLSFSHGFDFKFAVNAPVYILSLNCEYSASVIRQMVGRGNRAQGTARGRVFVTAKNCVKAETSISYIEDRDKLRHDDLGPYLARAVVKEWPGANNTEKAYLYGHLSEQRYRMT